MYYYIIDLVCFYAGKLFGNYATLDIRWDGLDYTVYGTGLVSLWDISKYLKVCDLAEETVAITALLFFLGYLLYYLAIGFYEGYTGKSIEEA